MRPCTLRAAGFTAALVMASACQQDTEAPSAPEASSAVTAAAALTFRQVSAGGNHTCAVTTANLAYCWGAGSGSTPKAVSGGLKFLEVSAGGSASVRNANPLSCGVTTAQLVYCWGSDLIPSPAPGSRKFKQVSVGLFHICAVNPSDVAFCWGNNQFGQLGTGGGSTTTPTRVAGGHTWRRVFAGATQTCGATLDNKGYCWGANNFGQGGSSGVPGLIHPKPTLIAGGLSWRQVRPGSGIDNGLNSIEIDVGIGCGVTQVDKGYCWGNGALGSSTATQSTTPVAVAGTRRWNSVQPGLFHTCGLTLAGVAFCWGSNTDGQLGRSGGLSQTPARVSGGLTFEGISVDPVGRHTCGVTAAGQVWCWGDNGNGQLGDGTQVDRTVPVKVVQ